MSYNKSRRQVLLSSTGALAGTVLGSFEPTAFYENRCPGIGHFMDDVQIGLLRRR